MGSATIHIVNGDSTRLQLERSGLDGKIVTFREALFDGPSPDVTNDQWIELRAGFLAREYTQPPEDVRRSLLEQETAIDLAIAAEHVVLWFEHDLFCSIHLWYLLSRFHSGKSKGRLELISAGAFPSHPDFRGLGELSPQELATLYSSRAAVETSQLAAGTELWKSFISDEPERLLRMDERARQIPFAPESLQLHVGRFPARGSGLGRIEMAIITVLNRNQPLTFAELFEALQKALDRFGCGDAQIASLLRLLGSGPTPLVEVEDGGPEPRHRLSEAAEAILGGAARAPKRLYNGRWLGGVRLDGASLIQWNEKERAFERD